MENEKQYRILVVDDTKENIETLFALLQEDYAIVAAKNGEGAIKESPKDQTRYDFTGYHDAGYGRL